MTVEECYRAFGGDYEGTIDRLVTEERPHTEGAEPQPGNDAADEVRGSPDGGTALWKEA